MEEKTNVWKNNLTNGVIMGAVAVIYSLSMYFFDLFLNQTQGYVFIVIQIALLAYLLKSYRDNYCFGNITYGQSVGAGVIICLYSAIIMAIFMYLLYSFIAPELIDKQLAFAEELMAKKGAPQSAIDTGMAIQKKLLKPGIIALMGIFNNMFMGTICSLIVSVFIKKEGNPLIDASTDQI